ncbi:sensor histidine kinase [Petrocella sp. FN5]|uniref:sensor histidine kinase n=1 Tax=Petrocella sp. FN5 TaxID=3032002 RepID=UPI0023DC439D|nr:HAMP domain-containing sensor histidine kinase [Petrocella sp. FN5]MDF1616570.1 HAMP domain-containing sensor histidine kinase [Petrocella sp. FN5]
MLEDCVKRLNPIPVNRHTYIQNGELAIIININFKIIKSIRTKLFISLVAIGILPLFILTVSIFSSVRNYSQNEKKTEMLRHANTISTNLSRRDYFDNIENVNYLDNIQSIIADRFLIMNSDGQITYDSNHFDEGKLNSSQPVLKILQGTSTNITEEDKKLNVVRIYTPIYDNDHKTVIGVTMLSGQYDQIEMTISRMRNIAYLLIVGISLIILILNFYFSGLLTKPFREFVNHLKRVSEGHIDERIDVRGNYEIEEIGLAFNEMLTTMEEIDDSRQRFVANVSHELKTPLSSMKVLAESLLCQDDVPKELYKEFMEDINAEVNRETKIINDLLTLVTLDKKESYLNIDNTNINKLVEQVMRMLKPIADKKDVILEIESFREVLAEVDETKMYLVFMNLIENSIKYNNEYGKVTVTINADHRDLNIQIMDTGVGIPPESVDKVFQRFYRVDKTRSRDTGGTGLGLSIVNKTILLHGGSIKCISEEGVGTTFILRLPLSQTMR